MRRYQALVIAVLSATQLAWLDRYRGPREGNRLYADGQYEEAAKRYNESLLDDPDSPTLHVNLGDALYKQGKYDEAIAAFAKVPSSDEQPARTAHAAYDAGNAHYRRGEALAASEPQKALGAWTQALAAYRRAMGAAPDDLDAKVNHEFVARKIAELKKKLEEQHNDAEQQPEQTPGDAGEQQEPQQGDTGDENAPPEGGDRQAEPSAPEEQQQGGGPPPEQAAGERREGPMSQQEAAALLDAEREREVSPEEITRRLEGAQVLEPARDW
jgi:tetratricopeptide (TPR) repeat protein